MKSAVAATRDTNHISSRWSDLRTSDVKDVDTQMI